MESSDSEGEVCGMERPSLVEELRTVLEDYPDNGQIFKELIQNAEDAGATKVRIIYDVGWPIEDVTESCSPHFQGAAIYVYNDASCTEEDWKGIRMLRKSMKKDDPMKIGRHGLGFKSVFHITDYPSVVSGDTLLLLDPSKAEDKTCARHLLSKNKRPVQSMRRTFARVFGSCVSETNTRNGFDGTIFRFPLRKSPSELSRGVYDDKKVFRLLKCFRTDMMLILVFLQSLESVEIWCPKFPELSFRVCLTDKSAKERRGRKSSLVEVFTAEAPSVWTNTVSFEVTDQFSGLTFPLRWTVASLCLGRNGKPMTDLSVDSSLAFPPFVGCAIVEDVPRSTQEIMLKMGLMEDALHGHVYCFLPLPLANPSITSLPVHINGFFDLSANRGHLKWPSADEATGKGGSTRWNEFLMTKAVPKAYYYLTVVLINTSMTEGNKEDSVRAVYEAFPSLTGAEGMWKSVVEEFYKLILKSTCFFSERNGGRWVAVGEAVLCESHNSSGIPSGVLEVLSRLGVTVCRIPQRLLEAVQKFAEDRVRLLTPAFVRELLKTATAFKQEPWSVKLRLLDFIMEDIHNDQTISQLNGIELLPLLDGTFTAFQVKGRDQDVLSPTKAFTRGLFRGLEGQFLAEISNHSFPELRLKLKNLSNSGKTQLRRVERGDILSLLERVSPEITRLPGDDIRKWLACVWSMLCSEFLWDLSQFEGLTLLPISTLPDIALEQLQCPSSKILKKWNGAVLSDEVESVVVSMGVKVLKDVTEEMLKHPSVVGKYVLEPTSSSVLQALTAARANNPYKYIAALTEKQRSAFVSFVSTCRRELTQAERNMLVSLPLFKAAGHSREVSHVSLQDLNMSVPEEYEQMKGVMPVSFPRRLIVYGNMEETRLGLMLGVQKLSQNELVLDVIGTMIRSPHRYNDGEVCRFMRYVLINFSDFEKSVWDLAKQIRFVPCSDRQGTICKPGDLIHPSGKIADLYDSSEGRFPSKAFGNEQILDALEKLGMLKNNLPKKEIPGRAQFIAASSMSQPTRAKEKFVRLMDVLNKMERVEELNLTSNDTKQLAEIDFLPVLQRPERWPPTLQWKADGVSAFQRPGCVYAGKHRDLVGSQCLLLAFDANESVLDNLGMPAAPTPADVVKHLFSLSQINISEFRPKEDTFLKQMYKRLYSFLEERCRQSEVTPLWMERLKQLNCVFVESLHCSPQTVAFECNYDCSPYLFKLSDEYSRLYPNTMRVLGVKKEFSSSDLLQCLQKFYADHRETRLDVQKIRLLNRVISAFLDTPGVEHGGLNENDGIMLPDQTGRLRLTEMLCFDDSPWIGDPGEAKYVHDSVSKEAAGLLGVRSKRDWCLYEKADGIQEPFGQKEELTTRLSGILQAYPCDFTILTELLQNADDAGATEIQFIKDWRFHKADKAFSDAWKELHGPALCVYNNAGFTDKDLEGIQNLGKGSKKGDASKTGKFGVGFNVVYHITDVPSFLIKSPTKQTLCAFDPCRKYLPKLPPWQFGKKWNDLNVLRQQFPDSVACYPDSALDQHQFGTLFRLPLRTESGAKESMIKPEEVTVEDIDKLLKVFQDGAKEALLFTKNVSTIKIMNLIEDGRFEIQYEVKAQLSSESLLLKEKFLSKRQELIHSENALRNIVVTKVEYIVDLIEQTLSESWFVKQQIGFENPEEIPAAVAEAYRGGTFDRLPTGGVAFPLTQSADSVCKAFCGVPLPIATGLPVHIEADFVLDYEHRSSLYHSPVSDVNTEWNKTVIAQLLAPLYASGLVDMREKLFSEKPCTANSAAVQTYHGLFPSSESASDDYWKDICQSVYKRISVCASPVLLVTYANQSSEGELVLVKKWLPVKGKCGEHGFFNTLRSQFHGDKKEQKVLKLTTLLKKLTFNIVETPEDVFEEFNRAGISVSAVNPEAVVTFLRTTSDSSNCKVGDLPCPLEKTLIGNKSNLCDLLSYCHGSRQLKYSLEGLPLLLTYDETLRVFMEAEQVFPSKHHDILPHSASRFLNHQVENILTSNNSYPVEQYNQVQSLQIADFCRCLNLELPQRLFGSNQRVHDTARVKQKWLKSVWKYLAEQVSKKQEAQEKLSRASRFQNQKESQQKLTSDEILKYFQDILKWSLIPVTSSNDGLDTSYLLPISFAEQIFTSNGWVIEHHLREMGVYFYAPFDDDTEMLLPSRLLVSCNDPGKVLIGLSKSLCSSHGAVHVDCLQNDQCQDILGYFSHEKQIELLRKIPNNKGMLKRLPFYVTVYSEALDVEGANAIVLPNSIPSLGMEKWSKRKSLVLLKETKSLEELYRYLELEIWSEVDFYCKYIFPSFDLLDGEARTVHLEFIRDELIHMAKRDTRCCLDLHLQHLRFIPSKKGLEKALAFYDRKHDLFRIMLDESQFVPEPFCLEEWREMLLKAGLVNEVSSDKFVELAKQLEVEGRHTRNQRNIAERSQLLIDNLNEEQEGDDRLLERIRDIKFLVPSPVTDELRADGWPDNPRASMICFNGSILPQYQELVWTTSDVLDWYCTKICKTSKNVKILRVKPEPASRDVVQNLQNILQRVNRDEELQQDGRGIFTDKLFDIFCKMFKFLQCKPLTEDLKEILRQSPCMMIQDHQCFVKPEQVVIELKSEKQIVPYLFALPKALGPYLKLLRSVGVSESPSSQHYERVLTQIRETYQDRDLEPGEANAARMATKGLYEALITTEGYVPTGLLYLPAEKGDSTVVWNSSEVVISDNPILKAKSKEVLDFVFLVENFDQSANEPHFDKILFWEKLPDSHKPQLLSSLVEERLTHSCESRYRQSESRCQVLKDAVSSSEVQEGIASLIEHFACVDSKIEIRSYTDRIQRLFASVRIFCLPDVSTCLVHQGNIVPNTETCSLSRHCEVMKTGEVEEMHIILQEAILEKTDESLHEICLSLCSKMPNLPSEAILYLHKVLSLAHKGESISGYLNNQRICEDMSYKRVGGASIGPSPGNFVPVPLHGSLDHSFSTLNPGQYVAYELSDPMLSGQDGDAIYVYAKVLELIAGADTWNKLYKIDNGNILTAPVTDLYAFYTTPPKCSEASAVCSGKPFPVSAGAEGKQGNKSLQEVKGEICEILTEAREMDAATRKKVLKRLLEEWHPDRNTDCKDFCTNIIQYIQEFEKKLEVFPDNANGCVNDDDSHDDDHDSDTSDVHGGGSWHCEMYARISTRTIERGRRYWMDRVGFTHGDEIWSLPNPQPSEGRRWLRQARADFEAIRNDQDGHPPSPAWACFKCQQTAEKALKAALFAKNANLFGRSSHCLTDIASGLDNESLKRLARDMEGTLGSKGHLRTRYPDMFRGGEIPADVYDMDKAIKGKELCEAILAVVESLVHT